MKKTVKKYIPAIGIGALAGLFNGLLGAGGGIIVTFFLLRLSKNPESEIEPANVFANAVATMLPVSAVSLAVYLLSGKSTELPLPLALLVPCAAVGGALGSLILSRLKPEIPRLIFAVLVALSGIGMIFK